MAAFREHTYYSAYRDHATALAQDIGAALAVFDIDAAAEFVSWIPEALHVTNVAPRADQEGLVAAVTSAARFDPDGALRVMGRIKGSNSHLAHVAVARAVAAYDLPRALAIVDGVDPRYSHTKAAMLGVVGNQLDPADGEKVRMVLDRLPRYVTSEVFFYALFKAAAAVVEEIARQDWDAAAARAHTFITRKIGGEEHKGRLLLALVEGGAASATDRAEALARTIGDDQPRAQALLAVARHRAGASEKRVLLIEAMDALGDPQTAEVRRDRVFAGVIEELAGIDPWEALDRALRVSDFERSEPLAPPSAPSSQPRGIPPGSHSPGPSSPIPMRA